MKPKQVPEKEKTSAVPKSAKENLGDSLLEIIIGLAVLIIITVLLIVIIQNLI